MSNRPPTVSNSFTSRQIEVTEKLVVGDMQVKTSGTANVFLGNADTGNKNVTGNQNLAVGQFAGNALSTGNNNNFVGFQAGINTTTGACNNFVGRYAGHSNTTGGYNNFMGGGTGARTTTGFNNNFVGNCAGCNNTTGSYNNFVGRGAGQFNTTGINNSFFGTHAGYSNTTGSNNTIIGNTATVAIANLSGVIALGVGAVAHSNNELSVGSVQAPLSTVSDTTFVGQVSSVILRLNGSLFRVPIIPV